MALSIFGFDRAFIVDRSGELIKQADSQVEQRYRWVKPLLQPLFAKLRTPSATTFENTSAAAAQPAGRAVAELMRLEGHPTVVGISALADPPMAVSDGQGTSSRGVRYLIVVRFLDGAILDNLSREQGLNGARFARAADAEGSEVAFQINASLNKEPIGFIVWTPDLPGSRVVGRLVPALSAAAIVLAVLFGALLVRLRISLSELRTSEHQARHLALHDVLTGLPNRGLFATRLDQCLLQDGTAGRRAAVALIDLDRFKAVNDTFGHAAGDELIRMAGDRMLLCLRPHDTLARLGGDEFAILLPDIGEGLADVEGICDRVLSHLSSPFVLLEGEAVAHIGGSIGVALIGDVGGAGGEVMRCADIALYEAKSVGRGTWLLFQPDMDQGLGGRADLKNNLRAALEAAVGPPQLTGAARRPALSPDPGTLEVHYQTIHRAREGFEVMGAEALVCWRHGGRGVLAPNALIPIAEESGFIDELGLWVLGEACRAACNWPPHTFVAVNVSSVQLRTPGFVEMVMVILEQTGMPPSRLEIQLTESTLFGDDERTVATIARLRAEGIKISLNDFRAGFSSFTNLVGFGIERLTIDRSFVALLEGSATGAAIVGCIVGLCRSLGIAMRAEGVETLAQRDLLIELGCGLIQGNFLGEVRPISDLKFSDYLRSSGNAALAEVRSAA